MEILASVWATIKGPGGAAITGIALLASGGLWWWIRRRLMPDNPRLPPTPGSSSPEHGKIDAAKAQAQKEMADKIRADAKKVREKLLGGGGVLLLAASVSLSCARVLPEVRDVGPIPHAYDVLGEACAPDGDRVCCSREGMGMAIDASAECVIAGEQCRLELSAEREHRAVNESACQQTAADLESARNQRWWFAIGGIVVGALVTGLSVAAGAGAF